MKNFKYKLKKWSKKLFKWLLQESKKIYLLLSEYLNKYQFSQFVNFIFLEKFKNFSNLRKLGKILSFTNILSNFIFYLWLLIYTYSSDNTFLFALLIASIITNFFTAYLFLRWASPYENTKWTLWAWISMVFVAPTGWIMLWYCNNDKYWNYDPEIIYDRRYSILHLFANSFASIPKNLENSINYLKTKYPEEYEYLINHQMNLSESDYLKWDNKDKHFILALALALQQNKKSKFEDIIFSAHWYDEKMFDFTLKDKKAEFAPVKYPYILSFVILDEFNNYQKILNAKKEIKKNLKFSPSKIICLYWGKGYKVYINA